MAPDSMNAVKKPKCFDVRRRLRNKQLSGCCSWSRSWAKTSKLVPASFTSVYLGLNSPGAEARVRFELLHNFPGRHFDFIPMAAE